MNNPGLGYIILIHSSNFLVSLKIIFLFTTLQGIS